MRAEQPDQVEQGGGIEGSPLAPPCPVTTVLPNDVSMESSQHVPPTVPAYGGQECPVQQASEEVESAPAGSNAGAWGGTDVNQDSTRLPEEGSPIQEGTPPDADRR
eukprot:5247231-Heterocapsa_arctica.AAC.1